MAIHLQSFAEDVVVNSQRWTSLGLAWRFEPVHPNYGKALVSGSFEAGSWAGQLTVWMTGEAELQTIRLSDGWIVNKHYDLMSSDDLEVSLSDLAELVSHGSVPPGAVTAWLEPRQ